MGVLQRSALCYLGASLLVLYTKPRTQVAVAGGILVAYWVALRFIPVPGFGAGVWTAEGNLARYLDHLLLPGRLYYGDWDPEGLLTTIPALVTCLLGVMAGDWLRTSTFRGRRLDPRWRAVGLFAAGGALALTGLAMSPVFPLNKKLWTSTFVLVTGGLAVMLLAAFHWLIDLRGHKRWAFPFVVVGMNSLFIYLAARFVPFDRFARWLVGGGLTTLLGQGEALFGQGQALIAALAQLSLEGAVLLWLYQRRAFIRL